MSCLKEAINLAGDSRAPAVWARAGPALLERTSEEGQTSPAGLSGAFACRPQAWGGKGLKVMTITTPVITSAIGLAYQTFTGPSISIFKPFPTPKTHCFLIPVQLF